LRYAYSVGPESCFGGGFERIKFLLFINAKSGMNAYRITLKVKNVLFGTTQPMVHRLGAVSKPQKGGNLNEIGTYYRRHPCD
jgi:hypothetical protein